MHPTSPSQPAPANRFVAFVLGFAGFLAFCALAYIWVSANRNRGTGYEDARTAARKQWHAESVAAQAGIAKTEWIDESKGLARISAHDYLPLAAKQLLAPENAPRQMQGDAFIVPGTPTFEAFAARQAAAASAPAQPEAAAPVQPTGDAPAQPEGTTPQPDAPPAREPNP